MRLRIIFKLFLLILGMTRFSIRLLVVLMLRRLFVRLLGMCMVIVIVFMSAVGSVVVGMCLMLR